MSKNVQFNETQQSAAAAAAAANSSSSSLRHTKQSAVIVRVTKYIANRSIPS